MTTGDEAEDRESTTARIGRLDAALGEQESKLAEKWSGPPKVASVLVKIPPLMRMFLDSVSAGIDMAHAHQRSIDTGSKRVLDIGDAGFAFLHVNCVSPDPI